MTDDEKTTAEEGLHYEALKPVYELPADAVYTRIPVIIYNKDEELEKKQGIYYKLMELQTKSLALKGESL